MGTGWSISNGQLIGDENVGSYQYFASQVDGQHLGWTAGDTLRFVITVASVTTSVSIHLRVKAGSSSTSATQAITEPGVYTFDVPTVDTTGSLQLQGVFETGELIRIDSIYVHNLNVVTYGRDNNIKADTNSLLDSQFKPLSSSPCLEAGTSPLESDFDLYGRPNKGNHIGAVWPDINTSTVRRKV